MGGEVLIRPRFEAAARGLTAALAYLITATAFCTAMATVVVAQPRLEYAVEVPEKIVTAEACGECHVAEYEVWKKTAHATGFKTLHRREAAETIAGKMGFKLIKRDSVCLTCHYTPTVQKDQLRAVSGVSCESCHGAGRDWIDTHNDYGPGADHGSESAEHRARRIEESRAAGMRRPSDLYPAVASCYGCHTVPNEELVNVGGHPAGSTDFELVEWAAGEVRHNFLQSFLTGDGTQNAEISAERRRLMYATGRMLDLEHSLRGVAAATGKGTYLSAMIRRVRLATNELRAVARQVDSPRLEAILAAVREQKVGLENRAGLLAAAETIATSAKGFLDSHDGTQLASLDGLVDGTAGAEDDELELAGDLEEGSPLESAGEGEASTLAEGSEAATGGQSATGTDPARKAVPAVGEVKRSLRPRSSHKAVGPGSCTSCHRHSPQNEWWFEDRHFAAADPFFDRQPRNLQIARFYGLKSGEITRGNRLCMDCHGTVISGKEGREVNDGVSCESCHGAAGSYLEPHQEGDKNLGARRPGYLKALDLGMVELQDASRRAAVCTGCHYVTDPRLISSGHPSGKGFDYVSGMGQIRHWEGAGLADGELRVAFDQALQARGAVPEVPLARLAGQGPGAATAGAAAAAAGGGSAKRRPAYLSRPRPRPFAASSEPDSASSAAALGLPAFPDLDPEVAVEETLRALQTRLELLYRTVGRSRGGQS